MESKDISGPGDGAGPSFSQSVEVLPSSPPNPPQMETLLGPSSSEAVEVLPPPPPLPPQMAQKLQEVPRVVLTKRPGHGRAGRPVKLLCNHFRVSFSNLQDSFHYDVKITASERVERGGKEPYVVSKILCRKVMDKVKEVYGATELDGKDFAYDGENSLFTVGPFRNNNIECIIVIDDERSSRRPIKDESPSQIEQSKKRREDRGEKFKVEITFAAKISMKALQAVIQGEVSDKAQDALRVLDIVLRQHASRKGYLLVRQSFFHWSFAPLVELGGGVTGCRGYHISFRPTQSGLSLNMDVSTTMLIKESAVIDFLLANQSVDNPWKINWSKAKQVLKGVRITTVHTNMEFKIFGLSEKPCKEQLFSMRVRSQGSQEEPPQTVDVTVHDYFVNTKQTPLQFSADLPCLDVGRKKRPNYLPIELCKILPGQRYTKALSTQQRTSLVEQSRQKPDERMQVLLKAMDVNNYNSDPLLKACNINVDKQLVRLDGRVLDPPTENLVGKPKGCISTLVDGILSEPGVEQCASNPGDSNEASAGAELAKYPETLLKFGKMEEAPRNGRWNFNNKTMVRASKIGDWAIACFNSRIRSNEITNMARELQQCCGRRGLVMADCLGVLEESPQDRNRNPIDRVERMLSQMKSRLPKPPQFLLCILPERKNSDLYGPWKRKFLADLGVINQCIAPPNMRKVNDQYLTNVALKINAKVGGLNSVLSVEFAHKIPKISTKPTIIIGMDVSHGSPGHADSPSISAVVSSREWPLISRYRASVRTQSPKVEMIEALYKPLPSGKDAGMISELLVDFYQSCNPPPNVERKPQQMIVFRDGVSESQFDQVLNVELQAIYKACNHIEAGYKPKVTLIIAQKNHHTKLFPSGGPGNVQPGTIVDAQICHPRNFDFYLCPQAGPIGTSRPTHYHVLLDENDFSVDDLQILVHALSYVYQRSTTAISSVAPINYAHLAASQMQQFLKAEDLSETASRSGKGEGSVASGGGGYTAPVPELPVLHRNVCNTMFFC